MKIGEVIIAWTPNKDSYPEGMRGKARLFPGSTPLDQLAPFACRGGHCDAQAHDPNPEKRQAYALRVAFVMSERDGLDAGDVHELMLEVDEYRAVAPDLVAEER